MIPKNPFIFRVYTVAGGPPNEVVVLIIGRPKPGQGAWECRIRIHGIPKGRSHSVGEDPLQAVQLALVQARRMLDASGLPLLWCGEPGDVGIPLPATDTLGFPFQRKMERYMERQSKLFNDAVAAFIEQKERRRAAKVERAEKETATPPPDKGTAPDEGQP